MPSHTPLLFLSLLLHLVSAQDFHQAAQAAQGASTACYHPVDKTPQKCIPEFENPAFMVRMETTSTCGENGVRQYCVQTSAGAYPSSCDNCTGQFGPEYLTDLHSDHENVTWWQSETMDEGIANERINLTLHLGKAYDITFVRIVFYSPRPQSFVIYKRTSEDSDWVPYQYYSANCREMYGLRESKSATLGAETKALCTSEYSDISPLSGGNVPFSTLEGRPSNFEFDYSTELQEWVTATDIRISLDRVNTFGDEIFADKQVLQSYWYAIADVAVGARCKCNGHASICEHEYDADGRKGRKVCRCEHNTAGRDCEKCQDFYNDAPWGRASRTNPHVCEPCNCRGYSDKCFFDKELYEHTGHGGHCLNCTHNRDGPNCERCKDNYYERKDGICIPCNCDPTGSRSLQCNSEGKCQCKPGVEGDKCDVCAPNHYDFTAQGCKPCGCEPAGSFGNTPLCDPLNGICVCKENVEGKRCTQCKPGYFNLALDNEFGCTPCFCYGHSSDCNSAPDYSKVTLESQFIRSNEKWNAQDSLRRMVPITYNANTHNIAVTSRNGDPVYFVAPDRFLGDKRPSYNHDISFELRLSEPNSHPSSTDVVLEGGGNSIAITIFAQDNPMPNDEVQAYKFRLHENPRYGWTPTLSTLHFMSILSNLTAIKIRGTYNRNGVGFLDNFRLETAQRGVLGERAMWVEKCNCPEEYLGPYCESCAAGFRHTPANGGPFMRCIACDCNKHTSICDSETGLCICEHNTYGDNCELCAKGFYGNAIAGTPDDCQPCPCPNNGACIQMMDGSIICTECPTGYAGNKCDLCSDGYYGDPTGKIGPPTPCFPCTERCNLNVDPNAIGNCNRTTGECLKCIYNTGGDTCDRCLEGYYGDALAPTKGNCKQCECFEFGTKETELGQPQCESVTGKCACLPHVQGRNCDKCEEGYYNIMSGEGCTACDCNAEGSYNNTCNQITGQCYCKPGVDGLHCEICKPYYYGFSGEGCKYCDCDDSGSTNYQCDQNGQCPCQENVEGRRCDRCKENKQRRKSMSGCEDCPPCYNLVQDAVDQHRKDLRDLNDMLSKIAEAPIVVESSDFHDELDQVKQEIDRASEEVTAILSSGDGKPLRNRLADLANRLQNIRETLKKIDELSLLAEDAIHESHFNISQAEHIIGSGHKELTSAFDYLNGEGKAALEKAKNKSDQFGQQSSQMSQIAQESRLIAESLETEAKNIKDVAHKAYNTSLEAYKIALDGINQQANITNQLSKLNNELNAAHGKLKGIQEATDEALKRAQQVYEEALELQVSYAQVNSTILVPKQNISDLQADAAAYAKKVEERQAEIEKIAENNKDIMDALEKELEEAEKLLNSGKNEQKEMDSILLELSTIRTEAENAIKKTNATLQDAFSTYQLLKEFNDKVQEKRVEADRAMEEITYINEIVSKANSVTDAVSGELEKAAENAKLAKDLALQAKNVYAANATQIAREIREKATATRSEAIKLKDEAVKLSGRVGETETQIDKLEKKVEENTELTNDAKNKVGQAMKDAEQARNQVSAAVEDINTIFNELKDLPSLDDNALDVLEQNLIQAERELNATNLEQKIKELRHAKNTHQLWIKEYKDEANQLEEEVENIKAIYEALPDGCFRKITLEPF